MPLGKIVSKAALAALGAAAVSLALAQPQAPRDPNMPDPGTVPPEKIRPGDPGATGSTGGTLSDKLERSEGVIPPPATGDAEIAVKPPVPNPGTTIVIPPPGSSPGDAVQPK